MPFCADLIAQNDQKGGGCALYLSFRVAKA